MRETTTLAVFQGAREIDSHTYCSAYNRGGASLVTDARGGHYVLLVYGEGHGTNVTSDWLKVFRLTEGHLRERANVQVREPVGVMADHVLDYRPDTPRGGGLVLSGTWTVDDGGSDAEFHLPERSRTVIELDTATEAGR